MMPQDDVGTLARDLTRRVRVLEERFSNIRKNIQVNEQNMLKWNRKIMTEVKTVNMDITDLKKDIRSMKENMMMIIKELRDTVKKQEVKVLEKYIQLWEPLNYVTHNELQRMLRDK